MAMLRLAVIGALMLLAFVLMAPAVHAEDLLQVYAQARAADPLLAQADASRGIVREGVSLARAPLLPQASAGFAFDQANGDERSRTRSANASVTQALVDVGSLARLKAAQANADAQDATYRAAEQALVIRVATAYFGVLAARDTLANVQANEDAYRQQVQQAETRWRNGIAAQVDVEQARAYHASARAGTIAARKALADAQQALAEITGVLPGELSGLKDLLPMEPPQPADPQAWVAAALSRNPIVLAQQASIGAAERSIDAARAGYLPTVSASAGVGRGASWPLANVNDGRTVTTVGVFVSVPLFAGGAQQAQVRQALLQRDSARDELELRRRAAVRQVQTQYAGVVAAIGQTEAQHAAVDAARNALASTRVGQELGTQTMTDLLLAIQTLTAAQNAYTAARHQFILGRLLLQQAAGEVGAAELAAVNSLLQ
jgi:outer membrane protein